MQREAYKRELVDLLLKGREIGLSTASIQATVNRTLQADADVDKELEEKDDELVSWVACCLAARLYKVGG